MKQPGFNGKSEVFVFVVWIHRWPREWLALLHHHVASPSLLACYVDLPLGPPVGGHPLGATRWGRWIRPGHQLSIPQEYGLGDQTSLVPSLCQALGSTWLKFGAHKHGRLREPSPFPGIPPRSQPSPATSSTAGRAAWSVLCCLNAFPRQPSSTRRQTQLAKKVELVGKAPFFLELIMDNISRTNHAGVRSHIIIGVCCKICMICLGLLKRPCLRIFFKQPADIFSPGWRIYHEHP